MKTKILVLLAASFFLSTAANAQHNEYRRHHEGHYKEWSDEGYGKKKLSKKEKKRLRKEKHHIKKTKKIMMRDGRLDVRERHVLRKMKRHHKAHSEHHSYHEKKQRRCR